VAIGSGVGAQFSFGAESSFGAGGTLDHFTDFDSESMKLNQNWSQANGLAAGRQMPILSRVAQTTRDASGSVPLDYSSRKMGLLARACIGSAVTTPTLVSGAAYRQVHQLGDFSAYSLVTQFGRPQPDGTVKPFTYIGTRVPSWSLSSSEGGNVKLNLSLDAKDELTATGLASYTPTTGVEDFFHHQLVVKLGGTASTASGVVSISGGTPLASLLKTVTVSGTNPLATGRYGTGQTKQGQIQNGLTQVGIELDVEFTAQSEIYDVWRTGTAFPVQLTWTGSSISGGANTLDLVVAAAKFTDAPPNVSGPDIVQAKATLMVGSDQVNNPFQWSITGLDSTL
jgi:hypothetical protein